MSHISFTGWKWPLSVPGSQLGSNVNSVITIAEDIIGNVL